MSCFSEKLFLELKNFPLLAIFLLLFSITVAEAQTSAFTYQGRLTNNSAAANGTLTMKFRLYEALTAGNQIGSEITQQVTVTNGIFTVNLDFGTSSFPANQNRWLEIQVGNTTLSPRQQLSVTPFAVRSLSSNQAETANNALSLGGVAANNYLLTSGGVVTGNLTVNGVLTGNGSGLTNIGLSWLSVAGTAIQAQPNKGYLVDSAEQVTITLPASPNVSDTIRVSSVGTGGFKIAQNAGQSIVQTRGFNPETAAWTSRLSTNTAGRAVALSADGAKAVALTESAQVCTGIPPGPVTCTVNGGTYTSSNSGVIWTQRNTVNRLWTSAASSSDGTKLVASVSAGQLYTSIDSGATWTPRDSNRQWRQVASSADGTKLAAVVDGGQIYISSDSGVTWTPRETNRIWTGIAMSSDGTKLVAVFAGSGGDIYTSTDSGVTWTPRGLTRSYQTATMSADGTKIIVGTSSELYRSADSGATWQTVTIQPWSARSIALSADGTKYIFGGDNSSIYISDFAGTPFEVPNSTADWAQFGAGFGISADGSKKIAISTAGVIRTPPTKPAGNTTYGTAGYLINTGQFSAIELQYIGNGEWINLNSKGTITLF